MNVLGKTSFWSFGTKEVQNGPKMRFFKFHEKLTHEIFLILWMMSQQHKVLIFFIEGGGKQVLRFLSPKESKWVRNEVFWSFILSNCLGCNYHSQFDKSVVNHLLRHLLLRHLRHLLLIVTSFTFIRKCLNNLKLDICICSSRDITIALCLVMTLALISFFCFFFT